MREALVAEGHHAIPPARIDAVSQPDDDAAPLTAMTQSIASTRNRERTAKLAQLGEALARLDEDPESFGECEVCDRAIPPRRLALMPWVALCVRCQDKLEREGAGAGRRRHLTDFK